MARLQALQGLHMARELGAQVTDRVGGVTLELGLQLAGFVAPGQPHQGHQHRHDQRNQCAPEAAATPPAGQGVFYR